MAFKHVHIIAPAKVKQLTSKATGRPFAMVEIQGLLVQDDGSSEVFVLEQFDDPERSLAGVRPGLYMPQIEPMFDRQTRKLVCRVVGMTPVSPQAKAA